jgi:hypothetical protein
MRQQPSRRCEVMRRILLLALLLGLAPAAAQSPAYPPEVQIELEEARKTCLDADGKDVVIPPSAVRRIDLTGDGRDDYIIFLHEVECKERPSVPIPKFASACGTLGSELRNQRDTSNSMVLVPLLNPKFATDLAARCVRTSGSGH